MSTAKKWTIIIIVGITFIVLFVVIIKNKSAKVSDGENISNNSTSSTNNVQSPVQTDNEPVQTGLSSSKGIIIIENLDNSEQVKSAIDKFKALETTKDLEWTNINNESKVNLTVDQFIKATGVNIYAPMRRLLDPKELDFISCKSLSNVKSKGVVFTRKLLANYRGDLNYDQDNFMKTWEKTILRDMSSILFPNVAFSSTQLDQPLTFKDANYTYAHVRTADIILPDGRKSFIIYDIVMDYIIVTNSPQCVDNADYQLFTPDM